MDLNGLCSKLQKKGTDKEAILDQKNGLDYLLDNDNDESSYDSFDFYEDSEPSPILHSPLIKNNSVNKRCINRDTLYELM